MKAHFWSARSNGFVNVEVEYADGYEPSRTIGVYAADRHGNVVAAPDQDPYDPKGLLDDLDCPLDADAAFAAWLAAIQKWNTPL